MRTHAFLMPEDLNANFESPRQKTFRLEAWTEVVAHSVIVTYVTHLRRPLLSPPYHTRRRLRNVLTTSPPHYLGSFRPCTHRQHHPTSHIFKISKFSVYGLKCWNIILFSLKMRSKSCKIFQHAEIAYESVRAASNSKKWGRGGLADYSHQPTEPTGRGIWIPKKGPGLWRPNQFKSLELAWRLELQTWWLRISCSTNWDMLA